jgi:hypothetical protein
MKRFSRVKFSFVWISLLLGLFWLISGCGGQQPAAQVVTPSIGEPKVGAPSPQQPGEEIGISIEIASTGGATLNYTWTADGGEIVRGQGSPAITYRVPKDPGTYNIRVKVEWDEQSVEKVTSVKVEGVIEESTPEPPADTPQPPADTPTPKPINTPKPTNTPKPPTATLTNTPKPSSTPTSSLTKNAQIIYNADLSDSTHWPERPDVVVSGGKLAFTPQEFEAVWANDFSQELDDFVVSATFSYDTQGRDDVGAAIVVGDSKTGNFFFLGANPNHGNTLWYFVMVKNWEHIHPDIDAPMTLGQPDLFSVEFVRQDTQVSAYVNGEKIMTREDIVFEGRAEQMQIGVHSDGDGVTTFLHKLSVALLAVDPTPTPTATIDADPTVYDNFNNPANDGSFNQSQWEIYSPQPNQIIQQDGVLIMTQEGKPQEWTALRPRKYINATSPTFFEAKLKMDPTKNDGMVVLWIDFNFAKETGIAGCIITDKIDAFCEYVDTSLGWNPRYETEFRPVGDGQLHSLRIDVDPAKMTFIYYLDGQVFGSYTPVDAEKFKSKATFSPAIAVTKWDRDSTGALVGYFDDVRIGQIGQ